MNGRSTLPWLALAALVLAACSSKKAAPGPKMIDAPECQGPAWTCFKSGPCPFEEFAGSLCAVGFAEQIASYSLGMEAASTRARREMGAVVQSEVDGFTRATQDSLSKKGVGEECIQSVGDLAQNVVDQTLNGVAVPKTWYSDKTKIYYAIAVVDRATFVNTLKGLTEAKGLPASSKTEIEQRADKVEQDWQAELARQKAQ